MWLAVYICIHCAPALLRYLKFPGPRVNKTKHTFKCGASECLAFAPIPIQALFVEQVVVKAKFCLKARQVFLAAVTLLELIQAVTLSNVTPAMLSRAVDTVHRHLRAEWEEFIHTKLHWLVNLPAHLARFRCLPSCFVQERRHRTVKRYAHDIQNAKQYEKHILVQVVGRDLAQLEEEHKYVREPGLSKLIQPSKEVASFLLSFGKVLYLLCLCLPLYVYFQLALLARKTLCCCKWSNFKLQRFSCLQKSIPKEWLWCPHTTLLQTMAISACGV